jgi:hypothetical protein
MLLKYLWPGHLGSRLEWKARCAGNEGESRRQNQQSSERSQAARARAAAVDALENNHNPSLNTKCPKIEISQSRVKDTAYK